MIFDRLLYLDLGSPIYTNVARLIALVLLLLCSTYIYTSLRFWIHVNCFSNSKTPPTLPYWYPYLGSALWMARDAHPFYEAAYKAAPRGIMGARVAHMYCYLISGAANVQTVYRNSKAQRTDTVIMEIYRTAFSLDKHDLKIYQDDTSGSSAIPWTDIPEDKRIWHALHEAQNKHVQGVEHLGVLSRVFSSSFQQTMKSATTEEWETINLYEFFRNSFSDASETALLGHTAFKVNPRLTEDFWIFFSGFLGFVLGAPKFMLKKCHAARTRLIDTYVRHLENVDDRYDSIQQANPDWDPDLGARVNRLRDKSIKDKGVSLRGRAALQMGFMIGINGNAIPSASWILIELVRDPSLFARVREEVLTVLVNSPPEPIPGLESNLTALNIDVAKLTALPLLSSIFIETLRLRMSTNPVRQLRTDLEVDGYTLRAGAWVMMPTRTAHLYDPYWHQFSPPDHPPDTFWAERFLASSESEKGPMHPKPGVYFPFGGGINMCPGRFFAKQEILIAIAVMVLRYEIEFVENIDRKGKRIEREIGIDPAGAGAGALFPDGDLRCRIRRRKDI